MVYSLLWVLQDIISRIFGKDTSISFYLRSLGMGPAKEPKNLMRTLTVLSGTIMSIKASPKPLKSE